MPDTSSPTRSDPLVRLARAACRDRARALATEWLETDGVGGYAASTILDAPTRRYHGLLVSRPPGASERHVFVSRFHERLRAGDVELAPSMARYRGEWAPRTQDTIESFALAPHPRTEYEHRGLRLVREVQLVRGAPTLLCRWRYEGPRTATLELRPLLPFRPAGGLTWRNDDLDPTVESGPRGFRVRPYASLPPLHVAVATADSTHPAVFVPEPVWYEGLEYEADESRGYGGAEDQFSPGILRVQLGPGEDFVVAARIGAEPGDPRALWRSASSARAACVDAVLGRRLDSSARRPAGRPAGSSGRAGARQRAELAADDFLYRAPGGRLGVDAGYPWFGEWGRDTFIALPGLTLARGDVAACGEVLEGALEHLADGLLPNVFGDDVASSHYGSADAALWFARAVLCYERALGVESRVRGRFLAPLASIAEAYERGAALGLEVDESGLLRAGSTELNATWMDARTSAGPVTPRAGCPVEINALWVSLLAQLEALSRGDERWASRRERAAAAFRRCFWDERSGTLADVWTPAGADLRVRPNMVIAAALEHAPLSAAERGRIVRVARAELLTPRGLRTLAPGDPGYVGRYAGGPEERDAAYHQGTAWPWLLGFYTEAALRASGPGVPDRAELARLWSGVLEELDRAGLNHVSEVFDGDPPHAPGGTFAQAWNTGELLRSLAALDAAGG